MSGALDFDPSTFVKFNVVDTCAIWNVISSKRLFSAACGLGACFCITEFVRYEALAKPRSRFVPEDEELKRRLEYALENRQLSVHGLDLDDLQDLRVLENRKRLGRGELSCIVFAKKTGISVLSDDRRATRFAREVLNGRERGQTTPYLLGWLIFNDRIEKSEVPDVLAEHKEFNRPLAPYFAKMIDWIEHCRAMV